MKSQASKSAFALAFTAVRETNGFKAEYNSPTKKQIDEAHSKASLPRNHDEYDAFVAGYIAGVEPYWPDVDPNDPNVANEVEHLWQELKARSNV